MLLSQILAWASAFLCIAAALRYPARASRVGALNRGFHKIHIPAGILLLATAALHGVFAGNPPDAPVAGAELAAVLFTVNWGTGCFLCAVLLAASYLPHKKLKKKWLAIHRVLALLMAALLALHLVDVGIHLPDRWTAPSHAQGPASSAPPESPTAAPTALPTAPAASAAPAPTAVPSAEPTPAPTPEPTAEPTPEPGLADGVYTGTGQGRNGPITVNVTVSAGKIAGIEITSQSETPKYFSLAERTVDSILSAQSPQVDAVTGATLSSEGIKAAVANALEQ